MLTSTGRYITGNVTEQGRVSVSSVSETGEYAPTVPPVPPPDMSFILSGGMGFGGDFSLLVSAVSYCPVGLSGNLLPNVRAVLDAVCTVRVGGPLTARQLPFSLLVPIAQTFSLVDVSHNFRLEQQP